MKRFLLWSFDRGSIQYDVICALILVFIFLIPKSKFDDRPSYMRVSVSDPGVRKTLENGIDVYTVKLPEATFWNDDQHRAIAVKRLQEYLKFPAMPVTIKPIYKTTGMTIAYAIWVDEGK
jgi:hypothetical protein